MVITTDEINKLPTKPQQIDSAVECVELMQQLIKSQICSDDAKHLLLYLVAIIEKETLLQTAEGLVPNQTVLNVAFRAYYKLIEQHQIEDTHFQNITTTGELLKYNNEVAFQMLCSILQTDYAKQLDCEQLKVFCLQAQAEAIGRNQNSILCITKTLNLILKRHPTFIVDIDLDHIYHCMQNGQLGMREETLKLFNHCCKQSEKAFAYFQVIATFWPWTNRNKYYLLSCILNKHELNGFLNAAELSKHEFFAGLRSSLSYKSLLAASQYLIRGLSRQYSYDLLEAAMEIFITGTLHELKNFYAHWFGRIEQKDELFELMKNKSEIICLLQDAASSQDSAQHIRLILMFGMFSKQIFVLSKLHFFKLSTELITNCFQYDADAQLLIFRFVIENLNNFAIEDCLDFLLIFMRTHISIESAQFRNTVLSKIPNIINYVSKYFSKMRSAQCSSLEDSILNYFKQLHLLIAANMASEVYQPKIFSLKLIEILLRSLYADNVERNAKNCCTLQNQLLGKFLIEAGVFDAKEMASTLLKLLNLPQGFDDALELIVQLLELLGDHCSPESFELARSTCLRTNVDECVLSGWYAKVAMQSKLNIDAALELFEYCMDILKKSLQNFKTDPLNLCSNENQLFGFLSAMNEIVKSRPTLVCKRFGEILELLETITNSILDMLSLWNLRNNQWTAAASFQDMDESLEILVQESSCQSEDHEASRKFLLMSFWLTLKAACELATTMGCILVPTSLKNDDQVLQLEQCLNQSIVVLTKCRHKGAIEIAGVCIGKLTQSITSQLEPTDRPYELLHNCLGLLFDDGNQVSTTRRGAGFSIMLLHMIKNEVQPRRPLLKAAMQNIMSKLPSSKTDETKSSTAENMDRLEALTLHYLGVLSKDTELRDAMSQYQNEIMLAAIKQIEHTDWTICNAALQLFGALLPKIIGQRQATEFETPDNWETTEVTYDEIARRLPHICKHILVYCAKEFTNSKSTRSIILFLGFLTKVEYLPKQNSEVVPKMVLEFRELMWSLLRHQTEKVRQLAALCFVRLHEFQSELPNVLVQISKLIFNVKNENFFESLIFVLHYGILKLENESPNTLSAMHYESALQELRIQFKNNLVLVNLKPYTLHKLLELIIKLDLNKNSSIVNKVVEFEIDNNSIGSDLCLDKVKLFTN